MRLTTFTLAERPDLGRDGWRSLDRAWPKFMHLAPTGVLYYGTPAFAEHMLLGVRMTDPDDVVARAATVPFAMPRRPDGTPVELPDDGWDEVLRWAAARRPGRAATPRPWLAGPAAASGHGALHLVNGPCAPRRPRSVSQPVGRPPRHQPGVPPHCHGSGRRTARGPRRRPIPA